MVDTPGTPPDPTATTSHSGSFAPALSGSMARRSRGQSVELQVARIGTAAAILVAVLAGLVGGLSSAWVANIQAAGESERSRADFLREQRRDAYTRFLSDSQRMLEAGLAYYSLTDSTTVSAEDPEVASARVDMAEAMDRLGLDRFTVALIGSAEASSVATRIWNIHGEILYQLQMRAGAIPQEPTTLDRRRQFEERLPFSRVSLYSMIDEFIVASRVDLDATV